MVAKTPVKAAETCFLRLFSQFSQLVFYSREMVTFAPQKQSGFFGARKPLTYLQPFARDRNRPVEQGGKARKTRIAQNLNVLIYNNGRLKISKKLWYCGSY